MNITYTMHGDSVADDYRNVAAADIAYSHGFAAGRAQPSITTRTNGEAMR